jgi:hypothetical protein
MNNYLDMMRTQVSWADRTDDPSAVQYGILLALASIAESLATPVEEKRPVEAQLAPKDGPTLGEQGRMLREPGW